MHGVLPLEWFWKEFELIDAPIMHAVVPCWWNGVFRLQDRCGMVRIYGFLFHSIIIIAAERRQQLSPLLKPLQTTGQNWFTFLLLLIFLYRCHLKSAPHAMDQWVIPIDSSLNFLVWMLLPFLYCNYFYTHTHIYACVYNILSLYQHCSWFLTLK